MAGWRWIAFGHHADGLPPWFEFVSSLYRRGLRVGGPLLIIRRVRRLHIVYRYARACQPGCPGVHGIGCSHAGWSSGLRIRWYVCCVPLLVPPPPPSVLIILSSRMTENWKPQQHTTPSKNPNELTSNHNISCTTQQTRCPLVPLLRRVPCLKLSLVRRAHASKATAA